MDFEKELAEKGLLKEIGNPPAFLNDTLTIAFDARFNPFQLDSDFFLPYREKIELHGCKAISIFTSVELAEAFDKESSTWKFLPPPDPLKDALLYIRDRSNNIIDTIPLIDLYPVVNAHKLYLVNYGQIQTDFCSVRFTSNNNVWEDNEDILYFKFWYNIE